MKRSMRGVVGAARACLLWAAIAGQSPVWADEKPALLGYGMKSCDDFITAWNEREQGVDRGIGEYRRYQDWLAGFVSGLNLATGQDVLRGADSAGALRRIQVHCSNKRKDDFFTAVMDLVKLLSQLR